MTIAITPFDGLCGFRPLAEISHFLATVPPLKHVIGEEVADEFTKVTKSADTNHKESLQKLFKALMTASATSIKGQAEALVGLAKDSGDGFAGSGGPSNNGQELAELVIRLNDQFPADIGLFALFLLNYVKLEPGEAMFLKADDIHAYLSGGAISYQSHGSDSLC